MRSSLIIYVNDRSMSLLTCFILTRTQVNCDTNFLLSRMNPENSNSASSLHDQFFQRFDDLLQVKRPTAAIPPPSPPSSSAFERLSSQFDNQFGKLHSSNTTSLATDIASIIDVLIKNPQTKV